jgi:Phage major capsid protein E
MPEITPYDLRKSDVLTRVIRKRFIGGEDGVYDISALAPITQTDQFRVRIGIAEVDMSGIGQFRAVNALTPLRPKREWNLGRVAEVELALLSEKTVVREDVYLRLGSSDNSLAQQAARDILNDGLHLAKRNTNLTRWMAWQGVQDNLVIGYPGGAIKIDFDLDNTDGDMSGSHLPAAPTPLWSDPNALVLDNLEVWMQLIVDDLGALPTDAWMSTEIYRALQRNMQLMVEYGGTIESRRRVPNTQALAELLGLQEIHVYDSVYRLDNGGVVRFLPENRLILHARQVDGVNTVEVLDGPTARYDGDQQDVIVTNNPGMVAEMWTTPDPPQRNMRVTTARLPIVTREALVVVNVL